jgi:integrase
MAGFSVSSPICNTLKSGGESWSIRYRYEGESRHRSETFPTREQAQARADEIRRLHAAEGLSADAWRRETTLEDWLFDWWPRRRSQLAAGTAKGYARVYREIVVPRIGGASMHQLTHTRTTMKQFFEDICREYNPPSQRKIHTALSAAFSAAVDEDRIERNPCARVKLSAPGENRRDDKVLKPDQIVAVWLELGAVAHGAGQRAVPAERRLRSQVFYSVLVGTGMRPSEACALQWGDIADGHIRVHRAVKADGQLGKTKTGRRRSIPAPAWLLRDLSVWAGAIGSERGRHELIFADIKGELWKQHSYEHWRRKTWVPAMHRVAARHADWSWCFEVDPYSAGRATHASLCLALGENPSSVARRLGNRPETLYAHYDHEVDVGAARTKRESFAEVIEAARKAAGLAVMRVA